MRNIVDHLRAGIDWVFSFFSFGRSRSVSIKASMFPTNGASPSLLLDDSALTDWFQNRWTCPDCGGSSFVDGPRGGMSQNIRCENLLCSSQYNVVRIQRHVLFVQRIHFEHPTHRSLH